MFTRILSGFVARSNFEDLPPAAVAAAKRGIIDFLGVTLAARDEEVSAILLRRVRAQCGSEASVIHAGIRTDASLAAYANGAMGHALDYDDVIHANPFWMGHPSVAILPAVLAAAEKVNASGKDLILAYCLGVEIYARVGLFCGDVAYKNGWHNTSFIGTMAAAGAAAKLFGLDEAAIRRCFGIAASMAGGLRQNFGTMTKPLHAGIAARNGVEAAILAQEGLTADENIFEAALGFRRVFSGGAAEAADAIPYGYETISEADFAAILGSPWAIATPGLTFKICPSCRATHFGMEAALWFHETRRADVGRIVEIEAHVPDHMASVLFYHRPQKGLEGKFSLEYVVARTLLDGVPKIEDFTDDRVMSSDVRTIIEKIQWISFEPSAGEFGVPRFVFKLDDGERQEKAVEFPRGEPENPVSDELLIAKFHDCARAALNDGARERLLSLIATLDGLPDVGGFANAYRA